MIDWVQVVDPAQYKIIGHELTRIRQCYLQFNGISVYAKDVSVPISFFAN